VGELEVEKWARGGRHGLRVSSPNSSGGYWSFLRKSLIIDEVVVLNGIALVTKYTQMMLKLHRLAGLEVSRKAKFKMPSAQVVKEFTNMWNQ
jgi:hypothetical protein